MDTIDLFNDVKPSLRMFQSNHLQGNNTSVSCMLPNMNLHLDNMWSSYSAPTYINDYLSSSWTNLSPSISRFASESNGICRFQHMSSVCAAETTRQLIKTIKSRDLKFGIDNILELNESCGESSSEDEDGKKGGTIAIFLPWKFL